MESPGFFIGGYFGAGTDQYSPEKRHSDQKTGDHFTVEDLFDFSNEDDVMADGFFDNITGNSTDSSTVTVVDSCNSSVSGNETNFSGNLGSRNLSDAQFSGDLCVPCDDVAELEWLSNFVEESFSSEDLQKLQLISGIKAPTTTTTTTTDDDSSQTNPNHPIFRADVSVPGKARSKRSRAAPCDWSSRLLVLSPATSDSDSDMKPVKPTSFKKRESYDSPGDGRRCLHCASEKTPQWRTGPMGPKTLCNACGVRFKSGRLVPEYRPAASPTFVSTKHSNSHRKVVELRRQKEVQRSQHQQFLSQNSIFGVPNDDDYLIHHHAGPDFRHLT